MEVCFSVAKFRPCEYRWKTLESPSWVSDLKSSRSICRLITQFGRENFKAGVRVERRREVKNERIVWILYE